MELVDKDAKFSTTFYGLMLFAVAIVVVIIAFYSLLASQLLWQALISQFITA